MNDDSADNTDNTDNTEYINRLSIAVVQDDADRADGADSANRFHATMVDILENSEDNFMASFEPAKMKTWTSKPLGLHWAEIDAAPRFSKTQVADETVRQTNLDDVHMALDGLVDHLESAGWKVHLRLGMIAGQYGTNIENPENDNDGTINTDDADGDAD